MSDKMPTFSVTRRGYDPAEVDRVVGELTARTAEAQRRGEELEDRLRQLEAEREAPSGEPVSFAHLGERVGQILTLAEQEAHEVRDVARAEAEALQKESHTAAQAVRDDADRYAEQRRSEAETEGARILEHARRAADERLDAAERDAATRLHEAECVYEDQRAKAAKASADFETTLARRRQVAEEEFAAQMDEARSRLVDLEAHIERSRSDADAERTEASRESRRLVEEAERHAEALVAEAKSTAARVRADSDRELAAASQRRDAINAQLANVRQMLTALTGVVPAGLVGLETSPVEEAGEPSSTGPEAGHDEGDDASR